MGIDNESVITIHKSKTILAYGAQLVYRLSLLIEFIKKIAYFTIAIL